MSYDYHRMLYKALEGLVTRLGYTATNDLINYLVEVRKGFYDSPDYFELIEQHTEKYIQGRILDEHKTDEHNALCGNGSGH